MFRSGKMDVPGFDSEELRLPDANIFIPTNFELLEMQAGEGNQPRVEPRAVPLMGLNPVLAAGERGTREETADLAFH